MTSICETADNKDRSITTLPTPKKGKGEGHVKASQPSTSFGRTVTHLSTVWTALPTNVLSIMNAFLTLNEEQLKFLQLHYVIYDPVISLAPPGTKVSIEETFKTELVSINTLASGKKEGIALSSPEGFTIKLEVLCQT